MKLRLMLVVAMLAAAMLVSGCSQSQEGMRDGYYSAEMAEFDAFGWKEFLTIYVSNNKIVTAEYNARNASGFIKSWDMNYMRQMNATDGTYPNEYTRGYMVALLNWQNPSEVDAITGATHSHDTFVKLAAAAIGQARMGDKQVALVDVTQTQTEKTEG